MKKVIVYTSNTCPYCNSAKEYLNDKGVDYEERNISQNKEARIELTKRGIRSVPTIIIGDEVVVGFDPAKLDKLLDFTVIDCPQCAIGLRLPKGKGSLKVVCPKCKYEFKTRT